MVYAASGVCRYDQVLQGIKRRTEAQDEAEDDASNEHVVLIWA